jgi:ribosomal protein S18 acetylase RimI-like enzyme
MRHPRLTPVTVLRLPGAAARVNVLGVLGRAALAVTSPWASIAAGLTVLGAGLGGRAPRRSRWPVIRCAHDRRGDDARPAARPHGGLMSALPDAATVTIESWTGSQLARRINEAMAIYVVAMNYPAHAGAQRSVTAQGHTGYAGFACRAALRADGRLVGFAYGYTSTAGQWWHDLVRRAVTAEVAAGWMRDAFELSEMHVLPHYQGVGIGRRLLTSLAGAISHRAILLSTPDADTRAFRLYRSLGFIDLARGHLFPGDGRPFAVLGARLPLDGPQADTVPPD